ncbi:hypothetical protein, unlikely [Trypanosoma brucei gambiense DAL972]|uniref:Uncharacterized protein n=1 Tax=Trypanosoma brucei gambiense (strain MHOM/CI/86/DAL972) TaxID=679716 RepID=C9ZS61_TRYB9|nr:hypothetical protein, unlikely [Trypanosoma brucei gambiense DAL972]CBH12197.1 hypothetical protein, unlikely [Trypanosoma brucei gambiense DAL972]|eukprot:XP_011774480.1 hypothetical protein, unlikely [Trypanosoma brucei gambiense DAL972]
MQEKYMRVHSSMYIRLVNHSVGCTSPPRFVNFLPAYTLIHCSVPCFTQHFTGKLGGFLKLVKSQWRGREERVFSLCFRSTKAEGRRRRVWRKGGRHLKKKKYIYIYI